jgi:hypothetical protein
MRTKENVERINRLDAYARNFYINEMDNDPCDDGLEPFVTGFIEGVLANEEGVA